MLRSSASAVPHLPLTGSAARTARCFHHDVLAQWRAFVAASTMPRDQYWTISSIRSKPLFCHGSGLLQLSLAHRWRILCHSHLLQGTRLVCGSCISACGLFESIFELIKMIWSLIGQMRNRILWQTCIYYMIIFSNRWVPSIAQTEQEFFSDMFQDLYLVNVS